jgi:hypothetical protein
MATSNARLGGCIIIAVLVLAALVGLAIGGFSWFAGRWEPPPTPGQQRCVATAGGNTTAITLEQAHYASIIAGWSVKRGLPPRAASIALATAYQESDIRNLDYGDRDSVGLFQQRPSQGWGTEEQLMDPHYASGEFYDALVKIRNWRTRDINDVAQAVQISGHPEAYRDHETDARVLASTLAMWLRTVFGLSTSRWEIVALSNPRATRSSTSRSRSVSSGNGTRTAVRPLITWAMARTATWAPKIISPLATARTARSTSSGAAALSR